MELAQCERTLKAGICKSFLDDREILCSNHAAHVGLVFQEHASHCRDSVLGDAAEEVLRRNVVLFVASRDSTQDVAESRDSLVAFTHQLETLGFAVSCLLDIGTCVQYRPMNSRALGTLFCVQHFYTPLSERTTGYYIPILLLAITIVTLKLHLVNLPHMKTTPHCGGVLGGGTSFIGEQIHMQLLLSFITSQKHAIFKRALLPR
jgi:hypothetical protein